MKTPNQNATDALEQVSAQYYYFDIGDDRKIRISVDARFGAPNDPQITVDAINAASVRDESVGSIELKLSQAFGTGVRLLETPMCDPATGGQGFSMVVRSPIYSNRKTTGPIL